MGRDHCTIAFFPYAWVSLFDAGMVNKLLDNSIYMSGNDLGFGFYSVSSLHFFMH